MPRLFDHYLVVDWSAASVPSPQRPSKDAIWIGTCDAKTGERCESYFRTRAEAQDTLLKQLEKHARNGERTLLGVDFPLGYPAGFASRVTPDHLSQDWWGVWHVISCYVGDREDNSNNRFPAAEVMNEEVSDDRAGPFWGHPLGQSYELLQPTSPEFPYRLDQSSLKRLRHCEERLKGTQEVWKLYGAGSVGSQALTGILMTFAVVEQMRPKCNVKVWPFESEFTANFADARLVIAEVWPSLLSATVTAELEHAPDKIRDQVQVRCLANWFAQLDSDEKLAALFEAPEWLSRRQREDCIREEGWILGA